MRIRGGARLGAACGLGIWWALGAALANPPEAAGEIETKPEGPRLSFEIGDAGARIEAPLSAVGRFESVQPIAVDRDRTPLETEALNAQVRVGLRFSSGRALAWGQLAAAYEHDLVTGSLLGRNELDGAYLPESTGYEQQLRRAEARLSLGRYLHVKGGFTLSHFGLGLVANDGAHGWTPGSAVFIDPRGGDRVLRATLATGPHTAGDLFAAVNVDSVQADEVMIEGDEAIQVSGAVLYGFRRPTQLGLYVAHRELAAENGGELSATVVDVYGRWSVPLGDGERFGLAGEAALVLGTTDAAGPADFPEQSIAQLGIGARASYEAPRWGLVLDGFYGTGDGDVNDDRQAGFRADPNYSMGLILFRHLVAGQTGRAAATAADPLLVGRAPRGIERFASRGGPTAALAAFPRAYVRPLEGLEIYGGPLVALATGTVMDPFNSQIAGGVARNALDGEPGRYLGTEIDLGARYRLDWEGGVLDLGLEGGVLLPGDAFAEATGRTLDPILAGRALLAYRL